MAVRIWTYLFGRHIQPTALYLLAPPKVMFFWHEKYIHPIPTAPLSHSTINSKSQISSPNSFKSVLDETQSMVDPWAKFLSLDMWNLESKLLIFKIQWWDRYSIDLLIPKGKKEEGIKGLLFWYGSPSWSIQEDLFLASLPALVVAGNLWCWFVDVSLRSFCLCHHAVCICVCVQISLFRQGYQSLH